jgi:hypothetical protein
MNIVISLFSLVFCFVNVKWKLNILIFWCEKFTLGLHGYKILMSVLVIIFFLQGNITNYAKFYIKTLRVEEMEGLLWWWEETKKYWNTWISLICMFAHTHIIRWLYHIQLLFLGMTVVAEKKLYECVYFYILKKNNFFYFKLNFFMFLHYFNILISK